MRNNNLFIGVIVLMVLFFVGGFLFKVLFKLGILALLVLGILYLVKKMAKS